MFKIIYTFISICQTLVLYLFSMQYSFSVESKRDFRIADFLCFLTCPMSTVCVCDNCVAQFTYQLFNYIHLYLQNLAKTKANFPHHFSQSSFMPYYFLVLQMSGITWNYIILNHVSKTQDLWKKEVSSKTFLEYHNPFFYPESKDMCNFRICSFKLFLLYVVTFKYYNTQLFVFPQRPAINYLYLFYCINK